jgi:hypothetical protein
MNKKPEVKKEEFSKEGWLENWYYFIGKAEKNRVSDFFIFNGSLTAKNIPPTKIPVEKIIKIIKKVLEKSHSYPNKRRL